MLKRLALAGLLLLALAPARAADNNVASGQMLSASSGNVAAATATATLAATQGYLNRICGFQITSSGSTGAAVVSPTVTGIKGGTMTFTYTTVAGATLANAPLTVAFSPCLPATGPNVAIAVALPSLGAGNTNATVSAQGYQLESP